MGTMETIEITLGGKTHPICFGQGALARTGEVLRVARVGKTVAVVSNAVIQRLYGPTLEASLTAAGFNTRFIEMPDG